jgi:hypothetical protein
VIKLVNKQTSDQDEAVEYLRRNGFTGEVRRADYVLALLRLGKTETAALMGKPLKASAEEIEQLPPGPSAVSPTVEAVDVPKVGQVRGFTDRTRQRMIAIQPGMTKHQVMKLGITKKELYRWTRSGRVKWKRGGGRSGSEAAPATPARSAAGTRMS